MEDSTPAVKASALAKFAGQLKAWRKRSGWSQVELADKLLCSDSLVSGVETTNKTPTLDFAIRCDEAFDLPGTFAALHELISREAWPSYFAPVIDFETRAVRIHEWELRVVPGLLQTEDYARAVISAGKPRLGPDALDRKVNGRMERQRILTRDNPPMLWSVLHEGALRHVIGSRAVMAEQLDKLIAVSRTPDVVIQVLPFIASDHPGSDGPISVFDFADERSVAYTECKGGGMIVESSPQVAELMTTLNLIRAAALPPRESTSLLTQIRSELDD
ncbi:MAG: helix-turn-helix transcriptional regulator [Streptosporangiaceae bacterium]|nr:helix-turn-helix transcriptional regulator [Streptosporangiaceae bacterium]